MASCLGIYIEPNIIKYAKVSKEHDTLRIESFGIKFYEKIGTAINQVINDTYSTNVPISVNMSAETYQYFYMFNLLNKTDLKKAIQTEYEAYCSEKNINKNGLETRYLLVNCIEDKEKIKVIHVTTNKIALTNLEQPFVEYKLSTIAPISMSIPNIANLKQKENVLIVNMENQTTITTIANQKIYQIDKLEEGAEQVLNPIAIKENSYSKAYEICKNSTIYTMQGQELLQDEENEYLENIMPTLYKIATYVKEIIDNNTLDIDKIYLTGTLSVVNNIDLYFQEVLGTEKCEILKPFFIKETLKINIKDYVEINSALALALQGLEYGIKDINFKKQTLKSDVDNLLSSIKGLIKPKENENKTEGENKNKPKKTFNLNFNMNLKGKFDATERWLLRVLGGVLLIILTYSGLSLYIADVIRTKNLEVAEVKLDALTQIAAVTSDKEKVDTKTSEYKRLSQNLKNISEEVSEKNKNRNNIPDLLSAIMTEIPQGVQVTSIKNTSGSKHIQIVAQSEQYEQLGYFKTILKTKGILVADTVESSEATKTGDIVTVTIEGDMP